MRNKTAQFYESLKQALRERSQEPDFIGYYNNDRSRLKDIPKTKSGVTVLMLGHNSEDAEGSIIGRAAQKLKAAYVNFENYRYDCLIYKDDDWFDGRRYIEIAIEAEREIGEFKGTVSDLLRIQGASKIGIFYFKPSEGKDRFIKDRSVQVADVLKYFAENGFAEAEGTDYLLMFFPDKYEGNIDNFIASIFCLNFQILLNEKKNLDVDRTVKTLQTTA
jgi:hypothetical protein